MPRTIKELRAERARLITNARSKREEITDKTEEARAAEIEREFDQMIARAEALEVEAQKIERLEALEASLAAGDPRAPGAGEARQAAGDAAPVAISYREAFHAMLAAAGDVSALSAEERNVLAGGRVNLNPEMRAQTAGTAGAGGNLVPDEAMGAIVKAMAAWGPMWDDGFCRVLNTTGGASMPIPGVDDTAKIAQDNASEGAALTDDGGQDAAFTKFTLDDFMIDTEWLRVSVQLATSSMEGMESLLADLLGERLGRKANALLTTGSGSGAPQGIVTGATASGITIAATGAVTGDELLDLYHSVDPAYRSGPRFRMMFNDNTLGALHKLKDGDGNYLVREAPDGAGSIRVGAVSVRYAINQAMADMGANARSIVIGDFGRYYVRKIGGVVLGTDRSAQFWPNFGIAGYTRLDGAVADAKAIKALVHPAS